MRSKEEFEEEQRQLYKLILNDPEKNWSSSYNLSSMLFRHRILELEDTIRQLNEKVEKSKHIEEHYCLVRKLYYSLLDQLFP
jgi:hypothetical protein